MCIPEFLSLYETERLVQELAKFEIDTQNIVINQVLYPNSSTIAYATMIERQPATDQSLARSLARVCCLARSESQCSLCDTRSRMQHKYIEQIEELYEDFHIVKMPLLAGEIRGVGNLRTFSELLVHAYDPRIHTVSVSAPSSTATSSSSSSPSTKP